MGVVAVGSHEAKHGCTEESCVAHLGGASEVAVESFCFAGTSGRMF